jgi:hypothetical protein
VKVLVFFNGGPPMCKEKKTFHKVVFDDFSLLV